MLQNRYQLQSLISQKQGRKTFIALDLHSQDLVIIKIVRFDPEFKWDDLKLFEREAATLQNLDLPAIPKYLDYFELADGFALVQTYIDAPSLETLIKAGRKFSEAEVIQLADRLLDILTYLHARLPPVIHRDIKPSNILLTNRSGNSIGDVYLIDFGSVQTIASTDNGTITIVGSYGYMPPEQFYGQTTTGSDLYSLGMTLIYLVTGTHPSQLVSVNGRIKFDRANLSSKFFHWIEKMTEYAIDRRFQSAKLAQIALTSTDGSYGEFLNLRPPDSRVELYRDLDRLEIKLLETASEGTEQSIILVCLQLLGLLGFFASWMIIFGILPLTWTSISWQLRISYLAVLPITYAVFNLYDKYASMKTYTGYKLLLIDRVEKTMKIGTYSSKNERYYWENKIGEYLKINLLVYQPSCEITEFFDEESQEHKHVYSKTNPYLSVYMGKHEYKISDNNLSEGELQWLGRELSDFLNLELQIIYPTPKIPAPVSCSSCASCGCC